MDGPPTLITGQGFWRRPTWLLVLAAVLFAQAGFALDLFGPNSLAGLTDGRPIVAGRHPLHLYHGSLGADTFRDRWGTACYDPAYQAGYPKTPVFDGGCRPAEVFLIVAGDSTDPATAYKWGVFAVCVIVPAVFAAAGRAVGMAAPGACLAAVAGCLVWWSPHVRAMLDDGNVDLLLAGLMGVLFVGGLVRYHAEPGLTGWLKMSAAAVVGWYAHPVVWLGLLPVLTVYYIALAPRHGLAWHLGLVGITAAGLAPNMWWLWDWGRFWWLRQPSVDDIGRLPPASRLAGSVGEYAEIIGAEPIGWAVFVAGLAGLIGMARTGNRLAAGVFLTAAGLAILVARLAETWSTLAIVDAGRVAPFAVAVLVPPAAFLIWGWWSTAAHGRAAVLAVVGMTVALGWGGPAVEPVRAGLGMSVRPFPIGFSADQQELVRGLRLHTTADARVLIEDADLTRPRWNWTALLASRTGRPLLGGLDPEACIDHTFVGMRDGELNGRPFAEWNESERAQFCRRYNVGWVLCRSPEAAEWWAAIPGATEIERFHDDGPIVLIALDRSHTFVLSGEATVERVGRDGILLTDAAPDADGFLVLSWHHQPGFRVAPSVVHVEGDPDPFDPIPMLRLRLPGPISRVVLTWENP